VSADEFGSCKPKEDPVRTEALTALPFQAAAEAWLETRRPYLAAETQRNYAMYIRTLSQYFAEMHLPEIDGDLVRTYQRSRLTRAGPGNINKEMSVLMQMRKRIGQPILDYQPLPLPKEYRGRALTSQEEKALETAGKFNRELEPAHLFAQIAKNTGGGPKEVLGVQLQHIDLEGRMIYFPRAAVKNDYRMRDVPLNDTAFVAVCRALEIAVEKGSRGPEHYLFPFRVKRDLWDPTRPQKSFKKAWAKICAQAGLKHFRMYDLRHHAATGMLSDPSVPVEAAIEVLGHVSRQMLKRYCHLNREAKRAAVQALDRKPSASVQIPAWLLKNRK
jgi:integrase